MPPSPSRLEPIAGLFREPSPERVRDVAAQVGVLLAQYGVLTNHGGHVYDRLIDPQAPAYRRAVVSEWGFAHRYVTTITLPVSEHPVQYDNLRLITQNDASLPPAYNREYSIHGDEESNTMQPRRALRILKKARTALEKEEAKHQKIWQAAQS